MDKYNPSEIESKWQKIWEQNGLYKPDLDLAKNPFLNLMMFPYPSAEGLHVGNMYAFTGSDIYGRFKRMKGFSVFEPIGLDGFGIHSENYALKVGRHPKEQAKVSESNFYRQLRATGNAFDWSRTVETYNPDYYKWTQWVFIQMFKNGLAYRKKAPVNFCPSCKTVLADEQVIDGKCERCSSTAEKRELEQWFFKITDYAEQLLKGLDQIDWTEKVKIAQRNWIGRSEGAVVKFSIFNFQFSIKEIEVFTTRPDTLYGATFLVLAPEHPISASIKSKEIQNYIKQAKEKTEQERLVEGKEKTGVFSGLYAINPLNEEKIPVWVAEYVLMKYGTGAIMGVPAHDQRDFEFAKKYGLKIKQVIKGGSVLESAYTGEGELINSDKWDGFKYPADLSKIISWLEEKGFGKKETHYHLRDWLISRQRYWGPPIPMINCPKCDWVSEKEENLPVLLPDVKDWRPKGVGESPLASIESFVKTKCPKCGGPAKRETDVSDTFLDSSWYFFRYISTEFNDQPFDKLRVKKWLPVEMYIGGAEHSVLHLMYARFITMAFYDWKLIDFAEPFKKFYAHGLLISEGAKMSKSKGNVIVPDIYIQKYGADTLRCYLMFLGPFNQGGDFQDAGIEGMNRFLKRVWNLFARGPVAGFPPASAPSARSVRAVGNPSTHTTPHSGQSLRIMHKTVKKVTEDIENLHYNTALAALMEWYNEMSKRKARAAGKAFGDARQISKLELETFLKLLAPFAPHMSEELWRHLNPKPLARQGASSAYTLDPKFSIHQQTWPKYDSKMIQEKEMTIVVQVNGKVRDTIKIQNSKFKIQNLIEERARESERVKKYIEGREVKKVIYVPGKIINFVVAD